MSGVLDGIRVLEWSAWHQGPEAGSMLGDLGADVIKIEDRTTGDPFRGVEDLFGISMSMGSANIAFEIINRNKRSITLDFKKDKGREILYKLVSKSDVFLTNYAPSTAKKLGADYNSLIMHNPKLVYAMGSGLGTRGPDSNRIVFDTIAQARSGIMFMMSDRDHTEPYQIVGGVIDELGGTVLAYGVVTALLARERKGIGQQVEVSLLGSAIHQQKSNLGAFLLSGRARARHSRTRARNPLTNQYRCADAKWLMLAGFQSDRYWPQFCNAIGHPELIQDPRFESASTRSANCKELIAILDKVFSTRTRDEWLRTFELNCSDLPYAPILELSDLPADPQVLENEYITEFDHDSLGKIKVVGCPVDYSANPAEIKRGAPAFGQHTEEVLAELCGYNWEELAILRDEQVI